MPVSGNEETGVKPMIWQSSNYSAGVPIKKRRFPLFRPPSPTPEEQSPLKAENDSLQNEHSSTSQGSTLSNASVATSSTGLSDAGRNEKQKGSTNPTTMNAFQTNSNYSRVKVEEPNLTIRTSSFNFMESKEELVAPEKPAGQLILGKTELQLAPNEALAFSVGKEKYSKQHVGGNCKSESSTIPGNIEMSLGTKEPLLPALLNQSSGVGSQNQERLESVSLDLSLSKGKSVIEGKSNDVELKISGPDLHANRSNWDLNTTMDAWEGSTIDAAQDQVHVDRSNATVGSPDIKLLMCSSGMVGTGVAPGKQIHEESERRSFSMSPLPSISEDSVHLGLSPSNFQSNFIQKRCGSSAKVDPTRVMPNIRLPGGFINIVNHKTVKSEPFDESTKLGLKGAKINAKGLLEVKRELPEIYHSQALKSLNCTLELVDPRSIKPELVIEGNKGTTVTTIEGTSQKSDKEVLQGVENYSCTTGMTITSHFPCPTRDSTCSTKLSINRDISNIPEHSIDVKGVPISRQVSQEAHETAGHVASGTISASVGLDGKESNVPGMVSTTVADRNVDDLLQCRSKFMDEIPTDSRGNGEGTVSDEEKVNISGDMLEEDSYGSEYDSDGNHASGAAMNTEQDGGEDDYEDGEVREPLVQTAKEDPVCEKIEVENVNYDDPDKMSFARLPSDHPTSYHTEEEGTKPEDPTNIINNDINESVDKVVDENFDKFTDKNAGLQESLAVEIPTGGADIKRSVTDTQRTPLDQSGRKDAPKDQATELSFDQTTTNGQETFVTVAQGADENGSSLPKVEASINGDDSGKDANNSGNRSRIINLSRASNEPSPGKMRSISARAGRERLLDVALEGDKLHPGGRDEVYSDGAHKFSRERHQDQFPRNPRLNFMRGRGRMANRPCGDWNSDRNVGPEFYNGRTEFRVPRHKYASSVSHADLEYNGYNIAPDDTFVGTGRGGRKPLNDEGLSFRHPPLRRQSPGGRDGPAAHGVQMVRRVPRNISPSRCIGEDGSELVGLRHNDKFMRGFTDETLDPMFPRPQPPYEGVNGFVRGNRNFSSVQRRGFPQVRSKSPLRPRTRSPGPWSSPRRRSPDAFGAHPDLPNQRSPVIYRMDRMRSPDRPCFPGDLVVRRQCSPPYMSRPSNDPRDMDPGRDHGHPRSVIPNRSPTGRVLLRNRRFDHVDPRERTDNDGYTEGPMHSGRFHELGGDGNGDERRRFGERRGPVRTFRPPYNSAGDENFHLTAEDGPRPYRFCPEDDSEFHERGNLREREFDRRIKSRSGNSPRRTRSIEEQEGNYRHGGQVWHDDGFDDISRVKRKRF